MPSQGKKKISLCFQISHVKNHSKAYKPKKRKRKKKPDRAKSRVTDLQGFSPEISFQDNKFMRTCFLLLRECHVFGKLSHLPQYLVILRKFIE